MLFLAVAVTSTRAEACGICLHVSATVTDRTCSPGSRAQPPAPSLLSFLSELLSLSRLLGALCLGEVTALVQDGTADQAENRAMEGFPSFGSNWLPRRHSDKESACQSRKRRFHPWVGKIPWGRKWQPVPVLLPREPHGQRSLVATVHGVTEGQTLLSTHAFVLVGTLGAGLISPGGKG